MAAGRSRIALTQALRYDDPTQTTLYVGEKQS